MLYGKSLKFLSQKCDFLVILVSYHNSILKIIALIYNNIEFIIINWLQNLSDKTVGKASHFISFPQLVKHEHALMLKIVYVHHMSAL